MRLVYLYTFDVLSNERGLKHGKEIVDGKFSCYWKDGNFFRTNYWPNRKEYHL